MQCRRPGFDLWVREDALEKGMATYSSILAWRIPWAKEPGGLYIVHGGRKESDSTEKLTLPLFTKQLLFTDLKFR